MIASSALLAGVAMEGNAMEAVGTEVSMDDMLSLVTSLISPPDPVTPDPTMVLLDDGTFESLESFVSRR